MARITNKKTIRHSIEPLPIYLGQEMMCHLLLKKDALALGDWASQLRYNLSPIDFTCHGHFLRTRMLFASRLQIISVKRLIDDNRVAPVAPSAHHRR